MAARCSERREAASTRWRPPDGVWSVDDAIRYVEINYAETFSLEWFVSRCAMNVSDFSRRFKERSGCPLFEFINRQRVKRACTLLKSSDLPIIEVASVVGYNNLSFFNRYFLRIVGLSPRAYRGASAR
ncbi:MAG: AraC family transcriptional regulator [Spirochaetales bacterium]|nr:MAG: AraC family transcriptional regulator [Spirochaetales bacterium]